jgi:hypothetical protein
MQYRIITETDEIIILTEDGGIALIREAADISDDQPRTAVTDYYHSRITEYEEVDADNVFELLAEGDMSAKDWQTTVFNSDETINDALNWLCLRQKEWSPCNNLFAEIFPTSATKWYINSYKCICGEIWKDEGDCMCDDHCPNCETAYSLTQSAEEFNKALINKPKHNG